MRDYDMPLTRPDFVITGSQRDDGTVRLIASRALLQVDLEATFQRRMRQDPAELDPTYIGPVHGDYQLTAHMSHVVIVDAPDYPAAFRSLTGKWGEQDAREGRRGVGGIPELGPG